MTRFRPLALALASLAFASSAAAQTTWPNVSLPNNFRRINGTLFENFDNLSSSNPAWLALTAVDAVTGQQATKAWANLGQLAPCISPFSGANCLELGLNPSETLFSFVQNALVMGFDGSQASGYSLNFRGHNSGEEAHAFDGVWVSDDGVNWYIAGAAPWSSVLSSLNNWQNVQNIDLSATPANVTGNFYVMIAQEDNLTYQGAGSIAGLGDGIGVDNIYIGPPTTELPTKWDFLNLPSTFDAIGTTYVQDFETTAGVLAPNMAVTMVDAETLQSDADGWANIGQLGPLSVAPSAGSYCLEMALKPLPALGHEVRNALVLGLNGGGQSGRELSFDILSQHDEQDAFDGVWLSANGRDWWLVHEPVIPAPGALPVWQQVSKIDFADVPVDTSGDFFLMFAQQDNFPMPGDGLAFDNIVVGPASPVLGLFGLCPGPATIGISGLAPFSPTALLWSTTPGSFDVPLGILCQGTTLGLSAPQLFTIKSSTGAGTVSLPVLISPAICGSISLQALDLGSCAATNVLPL